MYVSVVHQTWTRDGRNTYALRKMMTSNGDTGRLENSASKRHGKDGCGSEVLLDTFTKIG